MLNRIYWQNHSPNWPYMSLPFCSLLCQIFKIVTVLLIAYVLYVAYRPYALHDLWLRSKNETISSIILGAAVLSPYLTKTDGVLTLFYPGFSDLTDDGYY